jgi:hypothetical protein
VASHVEKPARRLTAEGPLSSAIDWTSGTNTGGTGAALAAQSGREFIELRVTLVPQQNASTVHAGRTFFRMKSQLRGGVTKKLRNSPEARAPIKLETQSFALRFCPRSDYYPRSLQVAKALSSLVQIARVFGVWIISATSAKPLRPPR